MFSMERLGVLSPDMVMIHMGWASPREIHLAHKHGFKISYTPSTGLRLGMGDSDYGRFPEMAALGITVSLCCNSAMSSNYLDMVRLINLGGGAMRSKRLSAFVFPPEEMIEMATLNGAIAVGMQDDLGSIEVGKKADLALFDTRGRTGGLFSIHCRICAQLARWGAYRHRQRRGPDGRGPRPCDR